MPVADLKRRLLARSLIFDRLWWRWDRGVYVEFSDPSGSMTIRLRKRAA